MGIPSKLNMRSLAMRFLLRGTKEKNRHPNGCVGVGISPEANIRTLAAYKQARSRCDSVTLERKQHSVVFLYSRAVSLRALRGVCEPIA